MGAFSVFITIFSFDMVYKKGAKKGAGRNAYIMWH